MYTLSGRGMQVGRGENRSLGFYGVGKLADTTLDISASGSGVTVASETPDLTSANAWVNAGGGDSSATVDPTTGLATYVRSYSNPYPTPVPVTTSNNTNLILIAVGVVGLMIMLKR